MMLNLPKQNKYLLACSYGPDSMALFQMLKNEGYHFDVAHIQYNLREDSKKECEDLLRYCAEQGIKCFAYKVEEKIERNIEERCREIRYVQIRLTDLSGVAELLRVGLGKKNSNY